MISELVAIHSMPNSKMYEHQRDTLIKRFYKSRHMPRKKKKLVRKHLNKLWAINEHFKTVTE